MMFAPRVLVIFLLGFVSINFAEDSHPDMFGLLNILYIKADVDRDMIVTLAELGQMFETMDTDGDGRVNQTEFTRMWLPLSGHSQEMTHAYFLLWDGNSDGELDSQDDIRLYAIFDQNGNGVVEAQEFNEVFQTIYHRVPFAVLFDRVSRREGNVHQLNQDQFSQIFGSLPTEDDGSVTEESFKAAWVDSKFGNAEDAFQLFSKLDTDNDGRISRNEMATKFGSLDKNGDGSLDIREVYVLGDLVNHD